MEQFYDISLLVDILAVAIIAICVIVYAMSGFLSAIVDLGGKLASLIVSFFASKFLAAWIFKTFIRPSMHASIMKIMEENNITDILEGIKKVLSFLPDKIIELLSENVTPMLGESAEAISTQIIDQVVAPAIVPIIMLLIFIVIFVILLALAGVASKALKKTKKIPIIGAANTALGGITGAAVGVVYVCVFSLILWVISSANGRAGFAQLEFDNSILYKIVSFLFT